ncbi:MAG: hypothetical protein CMJ19_13885 [Phycisphaeraceae bacterium]|nr:hypothetical protein [Phycisphaeraceae bacterium]
MIGLQVNLVTAKPRLPKEHTDLTVKQVNQRPISSHFGVCTHLHREPAGWSNEMLPMIRNMGMSTYREGVLWHEVEKEKGVYKVPAFSDEHVNMAIKMGMEPMVILLYGNKLYENPMDPEAFANYANHVIEHFKGRVKYFEVYNEPNNFAFRSHYGGMWNGVGEGDEKYAVWLLKFVEFASIVTQRIKDKHPDAFLLGYSMNPPARHHAFNFPDAWKNLDAIAIHPYSKRLPPEQRLYGGEGITKLDGIKTADDDHSVESMIRLNREKLDAMGLKHVKIWVTEAGNTTARFVKSHGNFAGYNEFTQAAYNSRKAIICLSNGIEKFFYYDYYDDGNDPDNPGHNFGLLKRDYSPKQSFFAAQRLNALLYDKVTPTKINVEVQRLAPWPSDGEVFHDETNFAYLNTPQVHSFTRKDGSTIVFVWRPGRVYGDRQEELSHLTIRDTQGSLVQAGRVVTGEKLELKTTVDNEKIQVQMAPYGSDPIYMIFK